MGDQQTSRSGSRGLRTVQVRTCSFLPSGPLFVVLPALALHSQLWWCTPVLPLTVRCVLDYNLDWRKMWTKILWISIWEIHKMFFLENVPLRICYKRPHHSRSTLTALDWLNYEPSSNSPKWWWRDEDEGLTWQTRVLQAKGSRQ